MKRTTSFMTALLAATVIGSGAAYAKTLVYCSEASPANFDPGLAGRAGEAFGSFNDAAPSFTVSDVVTVTTIAGFINGDTEVEIADPYGWAWCFAGCEEDVWVAALPGGGGTPLAAGLIAAGQLAEVATRSGQTALIAVLTDGKGNVAMDGTANRTVAMEEANQAARNLAMLGLSSIVIDISPRPREEAAELAAALNGRYLPLPPAQSAAMVAAIESI